MSKHILIMASGTGGHIFPGLAIAKILKNQGFQVTWLGTRNGMEVKWVSAEDIPIFSVDISGLRGKGSLTLAAAPFKLLRAFFQSRRIISSLKPDLVLAMGGFVCGPAGIAAQWLKIPLIIHEQNAIAGLTNRLLAKSMTYFFVHQGVPRVLESFPKSFPHGIKTVFTGNPIRDLFQADHPGRRLPHRTGQLRLLVLGGSLGALAINQSVPLAVALMPKAQRPQIYHQTGQAHLEATKQLYSIYQLEANVVGFIEDMTKAYEWADVVLCRAGAITLSELCYMGVGSILVPFPYAADNHQMHNARYLAHAKAAILMPQTDLTPQNLAKQLNTFWEERTILTNMAMNAYGMRIENAAQRVVEHCKSIIVNGF